MNIQLNQLVTLWRASELNDAGEVTYLAPVEIAARWESSIQRYQHQDGTEHVGNCIIYTRASLQVDDKVLLSSLHDLALASLSSDQLATVEEELGLLPGELAPRLAMGMPVLGFPYSLLTPWDAPNIRTIGGLASSPSVDGADCLMKFIGE